MPTTKAPPSPLPAMWVDRIFARMTVTYGRDFMARWEGQDVGLVKAHWAAELAGLPAAAIGHAIDNLPADRPPTVIGFRDLARMAPEQTPRALPPPQADAAVVERALSALRQVAGAATADGRAWALQLRAREVAGDKLTRAQREAWREALYRRLDVTASEGMV